MSEKTAQKSMVREEFINAVVSMFHEDGKWRLLLTAPNITEEFAELVRTGDIELAFVQKDGCLFFVADIADMGWITLPYEPQEKDFCWENGGGATLSIEVVDADTKELVVSREEDLELKYADRLRAACWQIEGNGQLERNAYYARAKAVLREIQSGNKMADEALLENILYIYG